MSDVPLLIFPALNSSLFGNTSHGAHLIQVITQLAPIHNKIDDEEKGRGLIRSNSTNFASSAFSDNNSPCSFLICCTDHLHQIIIIINITTLLCFPNEYKH